jgi:hypothetical protein
MAAKLPSGGAVFVRGLPLRDQTMADAGELDAEVPGKIRVPKDHPK